MTVKSNCFKKWSAENSKLLYGAQHYSLVIIIAPEKHKVPLWVERIQWKMMCVPKCL